jgi:hypothetical protein
VKPVPSITVNWHGLTEWHDALRAAESSIDKANRAAVVALGALAEREAKSNFSGSHRRGAPHVGGDKPNIVTGNLRRSITQTSVQSIGMNGYSMRVYPSAVYARAIELGRPGHNGAYPYFGPAIKVVRLRAEAMVAAAWSKYI